MRNRLESLISQIRKNPAMYLGRPSIFALRAYLDGYLTCLTELDGAAAEHRFMDSLQEAVIKLEPIRPVRHWDRVLWMVNRDRALERLWEILDEFMVDGALVIDEDTRREAATYWDEE